MGGGSGGVHTDRNLGKRDTGEEKGVKGLSFISTRYRRERQETKVDTEKEKIHKTLTVINKMSKHHAEMWIASLFLIFICVIFDAVPYPYCNEVIERIFTREDYMGNVISVIVVIWTFTISLSIYSLERLGVRYYGISTIDILIFDIKCKGLYYLAGMVLTELFSLIFAAVCDLEITMAMVAVQQFLIMIYLFLLICEKTSYDHILEQISLEIEGDVSQNLSGLVSVIEEAGSDTVDIGHMPMLFKMIMNLDYTDVYSRENLKTVLIRYSEALCILFLKTKKSKDKKELSKLQKEIIIVSQYLAVNIIHTAKTKENIWNVLGRWLQAKELTFEIKQGIIAALYEELTPQNVSICQDLIKAELECQRELQIWSAVYNVYLQDHIDEEWRTTYTERLFRTLRANWKKEDARMALEYWKCMGGEQGIYAPIFKYLFRSNKMEVL